MRYVEAKTENQKDYIKAIIKEDLTICLGPAGTGKSYIAIGVALELLERKDSEFRKIYITRPMESCGREAFPSLPGDIFEKYSPYMRPLLNILESFTGKKTLENLIRVGIIEVIPLELMRGMTFNNAIVILDEFQNASIDQAVMSVTRMGKDFCKMIYTGDIRQKDIGKTNYSGLEMMVDCLHRRHDLCEIIEFGPEDNQRNRKIIEILECFNLGL